MFLNIVKVIHNQYISKEEVFKTFGVPRSTGYELLKTNSTRQRHHDLDLVETRGRKTIVTSDQIQEMESILQTTGLEGRGLTWEQLGMEAGVKASGKTIKRIMGTMDYHKCIACQQGWVSEKTAANRLAFAQKMLEKYPEPKNWEHVRFSDEVHFG